MQNNYLRKALYCLGLVILIQLLKKLLDTLFPQAILFNHFLLSALQVAVLLWTIVILLFPRMILIKKVLVFVFILALPELLFTYWLYNPSRIPSFLHETVRFYSNTVMSEITQFNPKAGVYDSGLFYTLKPSAAFVAERTEFADSFYTNKMGLRDDDSSLMKPDIICIGDSYTMGSGIPQQETFPELLSKLVHKKVLNAGISSYGTARELKMLYRLDTSNLQCIIIQYCRNDYAENKGFVENNYSIPISTQKKYDSLVEAHYWNKLWFPGKHFITITKYYAENRPPRGSKKNEANDQVQQQAQYFADILKQSAINFRKIKVLAVDLSEREKMNNDFIDLVNKIIASPVYKEHFNNNLLMVPVSELLTQDDYYILDTHIRPSGHRKVAEKLANYF